jgi:hypothetical protein
MSECWGKAVTSEHKGEDQEKKNNRYSQENDWQTQVWNLKRSPEEFY